jgi:chemotaxis-related protein WspD
MMLGMICVKKFLDSNFTHNVIHNLPNIMNNTVNISEDISDGTEANSLCCWREVGVWGDRTCPELKAAIHCRNCPTYSAAGRALLEREAPPSYLDEWVNLLANENDVQVTHRLAADDRISVGIFRLGSEWLALPADLFKEVTQVQTVHTLPHRSNNILLGLVNIRGEILMCISLMQLLGIEPSSTEIVREQGQAIYNRMVVVEKEGNPWVFCVDEIHGIHPIQRNQIQEIPTTVAKGIETYTNGIIYWQDRRVGYLDDELLFYTLNRRVL